MFQITKYNACENGFEMEVMYSFFGEDVKTEKIVKPTQKELMIYFGSTLFDFLKFSIEDFGRITHHIRRAYTDKSSNPYVENDNWVIAYWQLIELRIDLFKSYENPSAFLNKLNMHKAMFQTLSDTLPILGRMELNMINAAIWSSAEKLREFIVKFSQFIKDQNPPLKQAS